MFQMFCLFQMQSPDYACLNDPNSSFREVAYTNSAQKDGQTDTKLG